MTDTYRCLSSMWMLCPDKHNFVAFTVLLRDTGRAAAGKYGPWRSVSLSGSS